MYVYETALILEQVAHELHGAYGEVSVPQYVKQDTLYPILFLFIYLLFKHKNV